MEILAYYTGGGRESMITNSDITIFNKRYVREERTDKFIPTRIKGVSFVSKMGVATGNQELSSTNSHIIRIPYDADTEGKQYVDPKTYASLSDEDVSGYWTLQFGAIIIPGLIDGDIPATETELRKNHSDVVFVKEFSDNRTRCSNKMKHWRVGGE